MRRTFPGTGKRLAIYTNAPSEQLAAAELMFLLWKARERNPDCHVEAYGDIELGFPFARWAGAYKPKDWALIKKWAGIR